MGQTSNIPAAPAPQNTYRTVHDILGHREIKRVAGKLLSSVGQHYEIQMKGIHPPTVIGALAAMTGERALLSCHPQLIREDKPRYISSGPLSHLFFGEGVEEYEQLEATILNMLLLSDKVPQALGTSRRGLAKSLSRAAASSIGGEVPKLSVPEIYYPAEWSPLANITFRPLVNQLAAAHHLSAQEIAFACAHATASGISYFVEEYGQAVNPDKLRQLALEVAYGVAHMVPLKHPQLQQSNQ